MTEEHINDAAIEKAEKALMPEEGKSVSLEDIVALLAPPDQSAPVPAKPAMPAAITDEQRQSLARVEEVFGSVVPTEVRALTNEEVGALLEERDVLAKVKTMAEKRMDGIRTTVLNHLDEDLRASLDPGVIENLLTEKDGHLLPPESTEVAGPPESPTKFLVVPSTGSASFDQAKLKAMADDPDDDRIDAKDYLAMTTQVRVFDKPKALLAIRKKPSLLRAVAAATGRGTPTLTVRQNKA